MAVTITLEDHLDISRGDMLCRPHNAPTIVQDIDAQVCWMDESAPLRVAGLHDPGARGSKVAELGQDLGLQPLVLECEPNGGTQFRLELWAADIEMRRRNRNG